MIEPGLYIRKAFVEALTGKIKLNGNTIPVLDSFGDEYYGKDQVLITDITGINQDNKHCFQGDHTLTIDIVTSSKGSGNKYRSDLISQQIAAIIQPDRTTTGLIIDNRLQLANLRYEPGGYLEEGTKTAFIVRKIMRYRFRIIQI